MFGSRIPIQEEILCYFVDSIGEVVIVNPEKTNHKNKLMQHSKQLAHVS